MKKSKVVLAFDFGASSGRAIKAKYDGTNFTYQEIHRFENLPFEQNGHLRWDFDTLLAQVERGIEKAGTFDSIGFDTWGVDFGLLDKEGKLLEAPVHYRDNRTDGIPERAFSIMDADSLYCATGTQIMNINSLFQLLAIKQQQPELLERAQTLLFMPDLFAYAVSGIKSCEKTIASTAQLLSLPQGVWNETLMEKFGLPHRLFLPPVCAGSVIGTLPKNGAKVVAVAGHDTQCACAAMPSLQKDAAFLSCGTWSLLGCELDEPVLTEKSRILGLSNELGANGKVNYLKNIIGLWLIQESRREWRRQGREYSYAELEKLALDAQPMQAFIDPDDPIFAAPGNLPERTQEFCRKTGQYVPKTVGEIMRCIYESLALKYRFALEQLESVTGKAFSVLHVLGGGTKDRLLCQMTASAAGRRVVAGPIEATALGNIIIQLTALGALENIEAGRRMIASTEPLEEYLPKDKAVWDEAFQRYKRLLRAEK